MNLLGTKLFKNFASWGLRIGLSVAFLSAVADRFGLWGEPGGTQIAWGNMEHFIAYSSLLNSWAPDFLQAPLAWSASILELLFGLLLLTPFKTKEVSFLSGCLLLIFAISMFINLPIKSVFDYSVLSGAFGAFYLSSNS